MHGTDAPAGRLCRTRAQLLGRRASALSRHSAIIAPRPSIGYANDSWTTAAIGWCGSEP
ncbi:hypothetical protein [Brevibacterium jeotgali]|uniref:hypothetical protein n=1 Tax=Brevibacterium jeotgali TaxID=1262550 RepID=UPI0015E11CED|nr:hypothetical protein [Brevibacterium jeotgali]